MQEMMLAGGKLPVLQGNIKKFGAGANGIVALSESGKLYSIGDLWFSGTGGTTNVWTLLTNGVEDFWVGYRQLLVKMVDGRWMFMGSNRQFPTTTIGTSPATLQDVTAYMQYTAGLTIKQVVLGNYSLAVVFTNGQYAMCGANSNGGLGLGNQTAVRGLTMRTDFTNVKKIDLEWMLNDTSYMLLDDGRVFGAGDSTNGVLGLASGNVTTWTQMAVAVAGSPCIDIVAGPGGWFRVVETPSDYRIFGQGRQFDGSLGTGQTTATNMTTPTLAYTVTSKAGGPPVIQVGIYCARFIHPVTQQEMYTGTNSNSQQGGGLSWSAPVRYSFTAMPVTPVVGNYTSLRAVYAGAYKVSNDTLYGVGVNSTATGYLPGLATRVYEFTSLDTTAIT